MACGYAGHYQQRPARHGVIPFTATFLQFADYMRPAIMAALMGSV
jgi:transketolase